MPQIDKRYFATYCKLDNTSEDLHCSIQGDAVAVGVEIVFEYENYINKRGKEYVRCALKDYSDKVIGWLPATCARRVADLAKDGWKVRVCASAVAYTEESRTYWLEAAVICYEPQYEKTLGAFATGIFDRIGVGDRPDLRLSEKTIDAALEDTNYYKQVKNTQYPKLQKGEAYYKRRNTTAERMAIQGAKRNPGCIVGTVFFYVALVAVIAAIVYFVFLNH